MTCSGSSTTTTEAAASVFFHGLKSTRTLLAFLDPFTKSSLLFLHFPCPPSIRQNELLQLSLSGVTSAPIWAPQFSLSPTLARALSR